MSIKEDKNNHVYPQPRHSPPIPYAFTFLPYSLGFLDCYMDWSGSALLNTKQSESDTCNLPLDALLDIPTPTCLLIRYNAINPLGTDRHMRLVANQKQQLFQLLLVSLLHYPKNADAMTYHNITRILSLRHVAHHSLHHQRLPQTRPGKKREEIKKKRRRQPNNADKKRREKKRRGASTTHKSSPGWVKSPPNSSLSPSSQSQARVSTSSRHSSLRNAIGSQS